MMPIEVTLESGQYAIIVMALLVAAAWFDEKNRCLLAGILLGISLLKPNISAPFCICFLVSGRFRTLVAAAGYVTAASVITWIVTKTNPVELLIQMQRTADTFILDMPNVIKALTAFHVSIHSAVQLSAAGGLVLELVLLIPIRKANMLWQYAIACVVARAWSYHRPYDDLMIVPLLIALGVLAARIPIRSIRVALFIAVGLTVWLPLTFKVRWPVVALQHVAWLAGLVIVVVSQYGSNSTKDSPSPMPIRLTPLGPSR